MTQIAPYQLLSSLIVGNIGQEMVILKIFSYHNGGALDEGSCRLMSILRNIYVALSN